ncbi:hypothetical protein I4U23_017865 [Adineta vaga]|nr:hypothetical protein I4U23_017865 [Adineta vaga]
MKGSEVPSDGKDCNSACAGPICASTCKNCPAGSTCIGNWDEGAWCMVGHKVCCCLKAKKVTRKLDIYNELLGRDSFNSRNNEDSNDQSDE